MGQEVVKVKEVQTLALNTVDAAKYLGLSKAKLIKHRTKGGGPKYAKIGRNVSYPVQGLKDWFEEQM